MRSIHVAVVPQSEIRNNGVGDYFATSQYGDVHIYVADSLSPNEQVAVSVHEIIELLILEAAGIPISLVDQYDSDFEMTHGKTDEEPGDQPDCPYRFAHVAATAVEDAVLAALGG
jgi:hypothetical protein